MSDETRVPAMVFHPAEFVADICRDRGWTLWDFAERIGALDTAMTVLTWEAYAACGPIDPHLHMGADCPMDLERVFGTSAEFWRRTAALCQRYPDRVQPLSDEATAFYGLNDEVEIS